MPQPETSNQDGCQEKSVSLNIAKCKGETNKAFESDCGIVIQDEDGEDPERDEDQMQLDDLMAACTTIRYINLNILESIMIAL